MDIEDSRNGLVTCGRVYGLEEGIIASGLPMETECSGLEFAARAHGLDWLDDETGSEPTGDRDVDRAVRLGAWKSGEGHNCWMCGAVVQFNLTAPRYFWHEWQRYHFQDIVSSTSTMHRLKTVLRECAAFPRRSDAEAHLMKHFDSRMPAEMVSVFCSMASGILEDRELTEAEKTRRIKLLLPEGWLQTARVTTNYRQLKCIVHQRSAHVLEEWDEFIEWCRTLPCSGMLFSWK